MKICPTCRKTYDDDGLNFCLEDGSVLTFAPVDAAPTVVMEHPRPTNPAPTGWTPQNPAPYSMQPKKKSSKTWVWVLAIFAILVLVCGGGFVGFFLYVASVANSNVTANKGTNNSTTTTKTNTNTFTKSTPSPSASVAGEAEEIDISGWVEDPTVWLETEFADGEFFMTSKQKGYYYVLVAKNDEFSGATGARVTVRNAEDKDASMGYGLVFDSETTPLTNGYAFLIDTKRKKYRVVRHESEQEKTVTAWTSSNLIKAGSEPNVLEARGSGEKIELYINGQLATTITNKQGPKSGVPGLYVGDGAKIGFRKLEVVK
jgi:hypothetical protein